MHEHLRLYNSKAVGDNNAYHQGRQLMKRTQPVRAGVGLYINICEEKQNGV